MAMPIHSGTNPRNHVKHYFYRWSLEDFYYYILYYYCYLVAYYYIILLYIITFERRYIYLLRIYARFRMNECEGNNNNKVSFEDIYTCLRTCIFVWL